jgi:glyoxylase-like metal-dependent hydrolase (beta-lactamase superfamily II)
MPESAPLPPLSGDLPVQPWEVYAIRFSRLHRRRRDALLLCPPATAEDPIDMDYSMWVARSGQQTIVVDTGYSPELGERLGRTFLCDPVEVVRDLGVDPESVENVVLTHLHYDHAGNLDAFPAAAVHVHEAELPAPAWHAPEPAIAFAYDPEHVKAVEAAAAEGRLRLLSGSTALLPGVEVHHMAGHTPGSMAVRIWTARGWLVLAGDASHVLANVQERRPYPLYADLRRTFEDYDALTRLAPDPDLLVPGHEASVIDRYPPARADLAGRVARLDLPPVGGPGPGARDE